MLQTWCSLENWKTYFCGPDHVSSVVHWATMTGNGFKPVPAPLVSGTGTAEPLTPSTHHVPVDLASRRLTDTDVWDRSHPLRLSAPIKGPGGRSFLSFHHFPNVEVSHRRTRYQLAIILPHHSSIPCTWILPVTLQSFCPRFRRHRPSPPPSITHHVASMHQSPVSSSLSASPTLARNLIGCLTSPSHLCS
jgi:hypothetical protein